MLVTTSNLEEVLHTLSSEPILGADTETFGLEHHHDAFSIILHGATEGFYFNFYSGQDHLGNVAPAGSIFGSDVKEVVVRLALQKAQVVFLHNAQYDLLRMIRGTSLTTYDITAKVYCTRTLERLIRNDQLAKGYYSLEKCSERRGFSKDDAVKKYIAEHKLYTMTTRDGRKSRSKELHFDLVPLDLLVPYGVCDALCTRKLGLSQLQYIQKNKMEPDLISKSRKLQLTLTHSAIIGLRTDPLFIKHAMAWEKQQNTHHRFEFNSKYGIPFVDGPKTLSKVFQLLNLHVTKTEKGNPSFTDAVLSKYGSELDTIKAIRSSERRYGTYFSSYKFYSELSPSGRIHPTIDPDGARTGRTSAQRPNIQNLPKRKEDINTEYKVRGCFIPDDDMVFAAIDYDQQEYRLMLDYAGEMGIIKMILEDGLDVHTATAKLVGVTRPQAKTVNFGILYGQGKQALAESLGVSLGDARDIINRFFANAPRVKLLIDQVKAAAKHRGWIKTWSGRILYFDPDKNYKAPNGLIQGGCADVTKHAMVECYDYLKDKRSYLSIPIHDEIIFGIYKSEIDIVPELQKIMTNIYQPKNGLYLTCGADICPDNLAEKISYEKYVGEQNGKHIL